MDEGSNRVTDSVCGMEFDPQRSDFKSEYEGELYYFCCPVCKKQFDAEPEKYAHDV